MALVPDIVVTKDIIHFGDILNHMDENGKNIHFIEIVVLLKHSQISIAPTIIIQNLESIVPKLEYKILCMEKIKIKECKLYIIKKCPNHSYFEEFILCLASMIQKYISIIMFEYNAPINFCQLYFNFESLFLDN